MYIRKSGYALHNAMVVPTLLYGCETWTILKRHERKLQAFEMMCLRRVEGVTRKDRVRNEEVRKGTWTRSSDGHSEGEAKEVEGYSGGNE